MNAQKQELELQKLSHFMEVQINKLKSNFIEKSLSEPISSVFVEEVYAALGWKGGTIHQVVDEIKRLKKLDV